MPCSAINAKGQFLRTPTPEEGAQFGQFTFLREVAPHGKNRYALCRCDCGKEVEVRLSRLTTGVVGSCGCAAVKHGGWQSNEYTIWQAIRQRCTNPNSKHFHNYGGRGITLCREWEEFAQFLADMGPRPSSAHSIDRINNDGPYSPENCRWATQQEQCNNLHKNRWLAYQGKRLTPAQWARETGLKPNVIRARMDMGWPPERILTERARTYPRRPKG